jgi:hypothetical protein
VFGIDELRAVVRPPTAPVVSLGGQDAWLALFRQFGTRLPEDFVQFHRVYGEGSLVSLTHELSASVGLWGGLTYSAFSTQVPARLSALRELKERRPQSVPLPLYWEPHGLLPWGRASNDADLCWVVSGALVDDWSVVVLLTQERAHERFDMSALQFLARVANGTVSCRLLPDHFPGSKGVAFRPWPSGNEEE